MKLRYGDEDEMLISQARSQLCAIFSDETSTVSQEKTTKLLLVSVHFGVFIQIETVFDLNQQETYITGIFF